MISNNEMSIVDNEVVDNVSFSDHKLILTTMDVDISKKRMNKNEGTINLYSTEIPLYNMDEAVEDDWFRYKFVLDNAEWKDGGFSDVNDDVIEVTKMCEKAITLVFPKKRKQLKGNRITKKARFLMSKKTKLRKHSVKTPCWRKLTRLRNEIGD